jgi:outer membrane protein assembly factor BamB
VSTGDWLVYHGSISGSGYRPTDRPWRKGITVRWRSALVHGQIYGEPLVDRGVVYVATEENYLYALALHTGKVLWMRQLALPVSVVGDGICGDISPYLGVTSTPVIDQARNEIFLVAATRHSGAIAHELLGVDLRSHRTELDVTIDPPFGTPGFSRVAFDGYELQRSALTLDKGRVVVAFGGNWGDCGSYHGFLIAAQASNGHHRIYVMNRGAGNQDALWMGGAAPVVDSSGSLWVTSGNGASRTLYDQSNSVLRLSPALTVLGSFYPANFAALSASDLDLGSGAPILLPRVGKGGSVLQVGKQGTGYLLPLRLANGLRNGTTMLRTETGVGQLCGDFGGAAVVSGIDQSVVYLPCNSHGLLRLNISASGTLIPSWNQVDAGGPPIVAGGFVWSIAKRSGMLLQLNQASGEIDARYRLGEIANSFPTPSASGSLIIATSSYQVVALASP